MKRVHLINCEKLLPVAVLIGLLISSFKPIIAQAYTLPSTTEYKSTYGFIGHTTPDWANTWVDLEPNQAAFKQEKELAAKYAPLLKVDPALLVWWTYIETGMPGAKYDSYHYSYCGGAAATVKYALDRNCPNVGWGGWQIGYGAQFADLGQADLLAKAYTAAHGNPESPTNVQKIGQAVLDASGIKKTFPKLKISEIMKNVSTKYQTDGNYWAYTLMRDPGMSVYILAQEMAWDINGGKAHGKNYRQVTASWDSYYRDNWQNFSNVLWDVLALWKMMDKGKSL